MNLLNSPLPSPTTLPASLQHRHKEFRPMYQQHLFQCQLDFAPRAHIVLSKSGVYRLRPVDSQDLDCRIAFEDQACETGGGQEVQQIDFRRVRGVAIAQAYALAAVAQAVEEQCASLVDRFPAIAQPVQFGTVGGQV